MGDDFGQRDGEAALAVDPSAMPADGGVVFIGRIRTPFVSREDCPKNMAEARSLGRGATVEISPPFRQGLDGLSRFSHAVILTWLDRAPRHLIRQKPRHAAVARGVFSLRSPARPNPIGLHVVAIRSVDVEAGLIMLDAIDVLTQTPVIDVKPYFASTDAVPEAGGALA